MVACSKAPEGGECKSDADCEAGYLCFRSVCITPKTRDQKLTAQSGVELPTERPVVGGNRIRVRTTHGQGTIFAQCASTERLTGGGCKGGDDCRAERDCTYVRGYPGKYADGDTLGARWYCAGVGTVSAFALCQEATEATGPATPTTGSGSGSGLRSP